MTTKEQFLPKRKRYQPITLAQEFSDEEMARDWTLSEEDREELGKYRRSSRLFIAIQLCAVRLYGRFLNSVHDLSPRIVSYLNGQLDLPPSIAVKAPKREATYLEQRKNILGYLEFQRFDESVQEQLQVWLEERAKQGVLPDELFQQAEQHLLANRMLLPGPTVLEKLIIHISSEVHTHLFESIYQQLSPELRNATDQLLELADGEKRSYFSQLKEYPPAAKISSLKTYLKRYQILSETGRVAFGTQIAEPALQEYLFRLTQKYSAKELKRFNEHKRYALMV